jgi:hypothetical protein
MLNNLPYCNRTTARSQGFRLKAPTLGTLQTLPDLESDNRFFSSAGEVAGFSLHAGASTKANERAKLERLCRYITRPAVSTKRLKRVFSIDIETCGECGGDVKIIPKALAPLAGQALASIA